ncbi:MAG TPA: alpha/beta fold hydrolase [Ilumatobacter sp.]
MPTRVRRVSFAGHDGARLAARLDLPAGPPKGFALFAHCFTCSKDLRAASRIAAVLTDLGYGLLRFDFTGLGASEGEFANTNFSSNVADLVAAADWLRQHHRAPQLLVGHSLGGAAVIFAAASLPEVRAVATIGAPADAGHVARLFDGALDRIAEHGEVEVVLHGRRFTIRRQFVDDLGSGVVTDAAASLQAALLVLHSPVDNTVGIEHAAEIYRAARHPKSFVTLDDADHLLTEPADAEYAASVIGVWAARYLVDESGAAAVPAPSSQVVVAETTQGRFLNHVVTGRHRFLADEPESVGGFDAGPGPYDLLAAALGACTSMTLRMYADRKGLPLDRVVVEVSHDKVHAADAASDAGDGSPVGRIDRFTRVLHLAGDLDDAQRSSLLRIADRCPVHRTLEQSSRIVTTLGRDRSG